MVGQAWYTARLTLNGTQYMGALAVKRFLKTAALLDSANEHERSAAARQASAMLREAGVDWTDVLSAGLSSLGHCPSATPARPPFRFEDVFAELFKTKPTTAVPPARAAAASVHDHFADVIKGFTQPKKNERDPMNDAMRAAVEGTGQTRRFRRRPARTGVSGRDIPGEAMGTPRLIERREKTWVMLVFYLDTATVSYGPMVAFDHIESLTQAMENKTPVLGRVTQPGAALHLPKFQLALAADT